MTAREGSLAPLMLTKTAIDLFDKYAPVYRLSRETTPATVATSGGGNLEKDTPINSKATGLTSMPKGRVPTPIRWGLS